MRRRLLDLALAAATLTAGTYLERLENGGKQQADVSGAWRYMTDVCEAHVAHIHGWAAMAGIPKTNLRVIRMSPRGRRRKRISPLRTHAYSLLLALH